MAVFETTNPKDRAATLRGLPIAVRTKEVQDEIACGTPVPYQVMTEAGVAQVEARLEKLDKQIATVKHHKNQSFELSGDGYHDNPGFRTLKSEEEALLGDKVRILTLLREGVVIDPTATEPGIATVGTSVTVRAADAEVPHATYRIVGLEGASDDDADEADGTDLITVTYETPIAKMLIGRRVGDTVQLGFGGNRQDVIIHGID